MSGINALSQGSLCIQGLSFRHSVWEPGWFSEVTSKLLAGTNLLVVTKLYVRINYFLRYLRATHYRPNYIPLLERSLLHHDNTMIWNFLMLQAEEFAALKIYDSTSTVSVTHSNSTLITQEPSNHPPCSRSNLSLLFIKCVTMNRRVLSEWQFNFHCLHYWFPHPLKCCIVCHHLWGCRCWWHFHLNQHSSFSGLRLGHVKLMFSSCLFIISTTFFFLTLF